MALPEHLKKGLRGEQLAARYLCEKHYKLLAANFRSKAGETDIIAQSPDGTVCFIEVKTRSPGQMLPPSEAVDRRKEDNLTSNADYFIKLSKIDNAKTRFDIIEVILHDLFTADINHIENAF